MSRSKPQVIITCDGCGYIKTMDHMRDKHAQNLILRTVSGWEDRIIDNKDCHYCPKCKKVLEET